MQHFDEVALKDIYKQHSFYAIVFACIANEILYNIIV